MINALVQNKDQTANGTFRPLTEQERITSNLILFTDVLPSETQKYSI